MPNSRGELSSHITDHLRTIATVVDRYPTATIGGLSALILQNVPVPVVPSQVSVFIPGRDGHSIKNLVNFRSSERCPFSRSWRIVASPTGSVVTCTDIVSSTFDALRWDIRELGTAVELIDSAANVRGTDIASFRRTYDKQCDADSRYRRRYIDRALELSCSRVQSIRETKLRLRLYELGYPAPLVQPWVYDRINQKMGECDLFYPQWRTDIEYDGQGKFHGEFGIDPIVAVNKHRRRSDRMASNGIWMNHVDYQSFANDLWVRDLDEAKNRKVEPFPSSRMKFVQRAWPEKFDTHPQWRWKLWQN